MTAGLFPESLEPVRELRAPGRVHECRTPSVLIDEDRVVEIQELLRLRIRHNGACDAVERKTRQKVEVVQQRIRDLQRMKRTLERLASACNARRATDDCPILEVLEDHDDVSH